MAAAAAPAVSVAFPALPRLPPRSRRLRPVLLGPPPDAGAAGAVIVRMSSTGRPSTTAGWGESRAFSAACSGRCCGSGSTWKRRNAKV